ncbi:MAG: hypothetical protein ABEK04_00050, partial [Candidatus Nanohalobium sp.]
MSFLEKVRETAEDRPKRFAAALFLLLFWMVTPLVAQAYYGISAINVSFAITVIYYVGMKVYQYR